MNFHELLTGVGLECPENIEDLEVSAIVTDSSRVVENSIFVCLCGSRCDGHDHIEEAIRAGAAVIVAEKVRDECVGGAAILVDDTRHTASLLYNKWYGEPAADMKIIGITGTNGKTSVAYMLSEILCAAGKKTGLVGTLGCFSLKKRLFDSNGMTTPPPEELYRVLAKMRDDGVEYVCMEVSSHALAQCRTDAIEFELAIFTNLSEDHLDFHKTMEAYYKAKEKLFTQSRRALVNFDDRAGRSFIRFLVENGINFKTCSLCMGDFYALNERINEDLTIEYSLNTHEGTHRVFLPLSGEFQVINSLEAAAGAMMCGVSSEVVCNALSSVSQISGRMETLKGHKKQDFQIFIDYAHTPDALEKLLKTAHKMRAARGSGGRIILLFGCGGERESEKRSIMGRIATRLADITVITSDNPRGEMPQKIISQILRGVNKEAEYTVIEDRREAIEYAVIDRAHSGDILLLAGKGHETYQIDSEGKHPFDERKIVETALEKRYS